MTDDYGNWIENFVKNFENYTDRDAVTEEIDAAYARANSIESNRDMRKPHWIRRKRAWIVVAKKLTDIRNNLPPRKR